jgi:hypothetical protein
VGETVFEARCSNPRVLLSVGLERGADASDSVMEERLTSPNMRFYLVKKKPDLIQN